METKRKEYDEEGREGLMKVPTTALLKEALVENGKLQAYIDELEDKLKSTEERFKISESKRCIIKLNCNEKDVELLMTKEEWHEIVLQSRCDELVLSYKKTTQTYKDRYKKIYKEWVKFLSDHKFGKDETVPFPEEIEEE